MPVGTPSIKITIQSFTMKIVVKNTRTENMKVQIGSMICQLGNIQTITAAINTPIAWMMSPIMWINAALTLMFVFDD